MGKKKKYGKHLRNARKMFEVSEESSDNESIKTALSDHQSLIEENVEENNEEDTISQLIDGLLDKSTETRIKCWKQLSHLLKKKMLYESVSNHCFTLFDIMKKCLKRGGIEEQGLIVELTAMLCFQSMKLAEDVKKNIESPLLTLLVDQNNCTQVRAKSCLALAVINFFAGEDMKEIVSLMKILESIFRESLLSETGKIPELSSNIAHLHASALSAWSFLLTLLSFDDVGKVLPINFKQSSSSSFLEDLKSLLKSSSLDVRMAAGECICLLYELSRHQDVSLMEDYNEHLCLELEQLATDSQKFRAKKDRKIQRSSFRDFLNYVQNNVAPNVEVKFGQESLLLDQWALKKQFDTVCSVLHSGITVHLSSNQLLRDIFKLGEKVCLSGRELKQKKLERQWENAVSCKARCISRRKDRNKRTDFEDY